MKFPVSVCFLTLLSLTQAARGKGIKDTFQEFLSSDSKPLSNLNNNGNTAVKVQGHAETFLVPDKAILSVLFKASAIEPTVATEKVEEARNAVNKLIRDRYPDVGVSEITARGRAAVAVLKAREDRFSTWEDKDSAPPIASSSSSTTMSTEMDDGTATEQEKESESESEPESKLKPEQKYEGRATYNIEITPTNDLEEFINNVTMIDNAFITEIEWEAADEKIRAAQTKLRYQVVDSCNHAANAYASYWEDMYVGAGPFHMMLKTVSEEWSSYKPQRQGIWRFYDGEQIDAVDMPKLNMEIQAECHYELGGPI